MAKKCLGLRANDEERWQQLRDLSDSRKTSLQKLFDEAMDRYWFGIGSRRSKANNQNAAAKRAQSRQLVEALRVCVEALGQAASALETASRSENIPGPSERVKRMIAKAGQQ